MSVSSGGKGILGPAFPLSQLVECLPRFHTCKNTHTHTPSEATSHFARSLETTGIEWEVGSGKWEMGSGKWDDLDEQ